MAVLVDELRALIDEAQAPLTARQQAESDDLTRIEADMGAQGRLRREMDARHRREQRLLRADELRFGLATLADFYRQQLADERHSHEAVAAITRIRDSPRLPGPQPQRTPPPPVPFPLPPPPIRLVA